MSSISHQLSSSVPAALRTSQWLKQEYLAHDPWQRWRDIPKLMQFDQRLGQLQKDASDQLMEVDYSTCYETMDQFPSEIIPFSVKSLVDSNKEEVIVIQASPGMGKSFLLATLCRYWAMGLGMRQYTLVFWVNMEAIHANKAPKTLMELLLPVLPETAVTTALCKWIEDRRGDNVMFILDGWNMNVESTVCRKLLSRQFLEKATIIVSTLSHCLQRINVKWTQFHLLSLTSAQISKQVAHYHSTDPLKAEAVLLHLASNPDIEQLASFPVYLYAILLISDHVSPSDLPNTWTEMLTFLTLLLMDPLFPEHNVQYLSEHTANFPINLPNTMKTFVYNLGKATFLGLQSNYRQSKFPTRLLYSNQDMNKGFTFFSTEQTGFFKFTFPLLEHFLAAVHLHQQPASEQKQKMTQQRNFPFIWQFYAGLSQGNEQLTVLDKTYCHGDSIKTSTCFYEAGLPTPTPGSDFSDCILTASDVHYILAVLRGMKNLKFQRCHLGTEALKQLSKAFAYSHPESAEGMEIRYVTEADVEVSQFNFLISYPHAHNATVIRVVICLVKDLVLLVQSRPWYN